MSLFKQANFDDETKALRDEIVDLCEKLETKIRLMPLTRERKRASDYLITCYMWSGRALRRWQIQKDQEKKASGATEAP